ncbi:MAG: YncE family protein, partial [Acidobacteria bacterium]|nr:YncE family protein [Acidobacteriota bacterium]
MILTALPLASATLLVANKSDDTVDLLALADGRSLATLETGHAPHEIAVSPDGRQAVITNYGDRSAPGSSLTVIDLSKRKVVRTIDLSDHKRPHGVVWLDASRVTVTAEGSANLLVVDVKKGSVDAAISTGQEVSHMVAVHPGTSRAFVANIGSGSVTVVDLNAEKKLKDIVTGEGAEGIAVRPGTDEIWVTNRSADTLSVIDAASLEIVATMPSKGFPIRIAFTPDGERALVSA